MVGGREDCWRGKDIRSSWTCDASALTSAILAIDVQSCGGKGRRDNNAAQQKNDIDILYEQKQDRRITIVTRPVKAMVDLQELDEALASFGGFSGVLELSASISSNKKLNLGLASQQYRARSELGSVSRTLPMTP